VITCLNHGIERRIRMLLVRLNDARPSIQVIKTIFTTLICPKPCQYYDQDAVICNEEPWNCPRNKKHQEIRE